MDSRLRLVGKAKRELAKLISVQGLALFAIDAQGHAVYFNSLAEQLFDCPVKHLPDRPFQQFVQTCDGDTPVWLSADHLPPLLCNTLLVGNASFVDCQGNSRQCAYVAVPMLERETAAGWLIGCGDSQQIETLFASLIAGSSQPVKPLRDTEGQLEGLQCADTLQSAGNQAEQKLQQQYQRALLTIQNIREGVIDIDVQGRVAYLNPVAERLTGTTSQTACGQPLGEVFNAVNDITGQPIEDLVWHCLRTGEHFRGHVECLLKRPNERDVVVRLGCVPMKGSGAGEEGAVLVFEDITERRGIERQLHYQACHDILTGLLNRREFENRVTKIVAKSRRTQQENALLVMDLTQFKVINDTCGHVAGDVLLKQVTALLHATLKDENNCDLARLGGDEFGLLLYGCSLYQAGKIAERVCQAIKGFRFSWFDHSYVIGISIGMARLDANSGSLAEVLSAAESACYVAKDKGRNHVHVYKSDDTMLNQRRGEMQWLHRINQALKEGQFCLYHQKILPLSTCQVRGNHSELLVRMIDERGQIISPTSFISAAERYQLMSAVDKWVIRAAFTILDRQQRVRPGTKQSFAINLSGQTLSDENALDYVVEQSKQRNICPERVCFEVTETAAINNMEAAKRFINEMKQIGYHFALDDFGSGMSSYGYLKDLPVDYLKIDGGFVRDMLKDETNFALVESINNMGHVMGVQTIAEYVEDDATLQRLWELGVDHVQGFCMAKPTPLWQSFNSDIRC